MEKKIGSEDKRKLYIKLAITLIVIFIILAIFILYLSWPLMTGKTIVLKTRPVDPFDILRGQYLAINYDISFLPYQEDVSEGDTIYVVLKENNSIWQFQEATKEKPEAEYFIKGKVKNVGNRILVEYGIEQYFFEKDARIGRVDSVEVKVSAGGDARISRLLYQGKDVNITYQPLH